LVFFGAIATLLLASPALADGVLARVNGTVIQQSDFNRRYADAIRAQPGKPITRRAFLDELIKRELGIQEARRQGLDRDPVVKDRVDTVLYHGLLERQLSKEFDRIQISEAELRSYYQKFPELRTSQIFVALPPNASPDLHKAATSKMKSIQEDFLSDTKMSFAEVAQRMSEGPTAAMGGDMDFQPRDRMDPVYYDAALKLGTAGKTSGVVRTPWGLHIIRLTAIRKWEDADKVQIRRMLMKEKQDQLFDQYISTLRRGAKVSTYPDLLRD